MNINGKSIIGFFLILFGVSLFFGGGHFGGLVTGAIGALLLFYSREKMEGRTPVCRGTGRDLRHHVFGRVIAVSDRHRGCCSHGLFRMENDEAR